MRTTPWDGLAAMWQAGLQLGETWRASAEVIAARSPMIAAALTNPAKGDWIELNKMVPEKMEAFSRAGSAALGDFARLQADMFATWTTLAGMASAGRPPSIAQAGALFSRMAADHAHAAGAGGRALAPVHLSATANAKRLRG